MTVRDWEGLKLGFALGAGNLPSAGCSAMGGVLGPRPPHPATQSPPTPDFLREHEVLPAPVLTCMSVSGTGWPSMTRSAPKNQCLRETTHRDAGLAPGAQR